MDQLRPPGNPGPLPRRVVLAGAGPVDSVTLGDPDLDALDAEFQKLRPWDKKTFLDTMDPKVRPRWDAYIAAKQQAFADANPPVPKLSSDAEKALRKALVDRYPNLITKLNCYAPVDCDGSGNAYGDEETDVDTSVHFNNQGLNADHVLYHVATMDHPEWYDCLAVHFLGGRMIATVFGDEGPAYGEASHLAIQQLGLYSSPIDGGAKTGHDLYLIPRLGAEFMKRGLEPTPENLNAFCREKGVPGF